MKKLLSIVVMVVMVAMMATTVVNATTTDELADKLYEMGAKYGVTSADKVKIERYLAENPVTESEANQIVSKAEEAIAVMDEAGVTDVTKLTDAQKEKVKTIANEAASVIDVSLVFKADSVEIYKDGKIIETVTSDNGKLVYTGNTINMTVIISSIAVIALALTATVVVVRKKGLANAR
jgi:hypothetical protein